LTVGGKHQWALYTNEPLTGELSKLPENWYEVRARWWPKYLWTQIRMTWEMWRRGPDIFFEPAHVLPPIRPEWSVVTVHDIGFHRYPQMYKWIQKFYHEHATRNIVHSRARIITPSEFTARELVEVYGADPSRIAPIYLGIDHERYRVSNDQEKIEKTLAAYRIPKPYFLYIGRLETKKNIVGMIKAFDAFKKRRGIGDPSVLVLAGPQGHGYEEIKKQIAASPNAPQILQIGYVPEDLVPFLMEGATGYLQVSWYEGFGIPPLQAMACGCPVIASNNSCMPEVLGEGNALFVAPNDTNAISSAMDRLIEDGAMRQNLHDRGIQLVIDEHTDRAEPLGQTGGLLFQAGFKIDKPVTETLVDPFEELPVIGCCTEESDFHAEPPAEMTLIWYRGRQSPEGFKEARLSSGPADRNLPSRDRRP